MNASPPSNDSERGELIRALEDALNGPSCHPAGTGRFKCGALKTAGGGEYDRTWGLDP